LGRSELLTYLSLTGETQHATFSRHEIAALDQWIIRRRRIHDDERLRISCADKYYQQDREER
jgi:hypothetical protein